MPLRVRIPAIVVGICVLTWMMRGGAPVVVNGIVDVIRPVNRAVDGAPERAAAAKPGTTAWVNGALERLAPHFAEGGALHGLEVVVYDEAIADESIDGGRVQTGTFHDAASSRVFVDVAYLAILDQFARPDPALAKGYLLARVLARHTDPEATGEAFEEAAGTLAARLDLIPKSWRVQGKVQQFAFWLGAIDAMRVPNVPKGWRNHLAASELPAAQAITVFARGLGAASD